MKYLEFTPFSMINSFLCGVDVGDYVVQGALEAYSCKLAGFDKKLSRSLEAEVAASLVSSSPLEVASSPLGPLSEASSRRTLIYLILTLNHMYPDYDFSTLRAHHFTKEGSVGAVKQRIDTLLAETGKIWVATRPPGSPSLLEHLWAAIDEVIDIVECDVYSYNSDRDGDPFGEEGSIWSFNYFFYNRKIKRILYFSCKCVSKSLESPSMSSEEGEYGLDIEEMDMY